MKYKRLYQNNTIPGVVINKETGEVWVDPGLEFPLTMQCPYEPNIKHCHNDDNHCYCCNQSPQGKEYVKKQLDKEEKDWNLFLKIMRILDDHDGGEFMLEIFQSGVPVSYQIDLDTGEVVSQLVHAVQKGAMK
jgi:hypothetical protein